MTHRLQQSERVQSVKTHSSISLLSPRILKPSLSNSLYKHILQPIFLMRVLLLQQCSLQFTKEKIMEVESARKPRTSKGSSLLKQFQSKFRDLINILPRRGFHRSRQFISKKTPSSMLSICSKRVTGLGI